MAKRFEGSRKLVPEISQSNNTIRCGILLCMPALSQSKLPCDDSTWKSYLYKVQCVIATVVNLPSWIEQFPIVVTSRIVCLDTWKFLRTYPLHSIRLQGNLITKLKNLQCAPINVRFPGQTRYGVGQSPTGTTERPLPELGTHLLCLAESSRQLPSSSRRPHFHLPLYPSANTSSAADRNDRSDSFAPLGLVGSNGHIRWRPINLDARQGKIYAWGAVG